MKSDNVFYVVYNAKLMAMYKKLQSALNYISRKRLIADDNNVLRIVDRLGNEYDPLSGVSM